MTSKSMKKECAYDKSIRFSVVSDEDVPVSENPGNVKSHRRVKRSMRWWYVFSCTYRCIARSISVSSGGWIFVSEKHAWQDAVGTLCCVTQSETPQAEIISVEDENVMWEEILGSDIPQQLVDTLLYLFGIHFALGAPFIYCTSLSIGFRRPVTTHADGSGVYVTVNIAVPK